MNFTQLAGLLGTSGGTSALGLTATGSPGLASGLFSAASKLGGPYAKYAAIAAPILEKVAEKLPDVADRLLGGGVLDSASSMSARTALALQNQWDTNHDGTLSQDELKTGLQSVTEQINTLNGQSDSAGKTLKSRELAAMQAYGNQLLQNYNAVSNLDGQAGVSVNDIKLLAFSDNQPNRINLADWRLLAPATATI